MTTQEAYEGIHAYFSRPDAVLAREGSAESGDSCVYRGNMDPASPIRCAVGCLIPDEMYRREMEDKTSWAVLNQYSDVLGKTFDDVSCNFLSVAIVLRDKSLAVQDEFAKHFPALVKTKDRMQKGDAFARGSGYAAGQRADVGQGTLGGNRKALR